MSASAEFWIGGAVGIYVGVVYVVVIVPLIRRWAYVSMSDEQCQCGACERWRRVLMSEQTRKRCETDWYWSVQDDIGGGELPEYVQQFDDGSLRCLLPDGHDGSHYAQDPSTGAPWIWR